MMDEYDDDMDRDRCYVNPFVGEGRYGRYLRNYFEVVPLRQLLLLNFDEWTSDAEGTMRRVFAYLQLAPYPITIGEAHNTHRARSVHVHQNGAQNLSEVADDRVADALTYARAVPRPWSRAPPRSAFGCVAPSPVWEITSLPLAIRGRYRTHCILHEFFVPYQLELDELLRE